MRLVVPVFLLIVGAGQGAPVPADFKKKTDEAILIQGTWAVVDTNIDGRVANVFPDRVVKFTAEDVQLVDAGVVAAKHTWKIETNGDSRRMIWTPKVNKHRDYNCAYSLKGDELIVSVGHDNDSRPPTVDPGPRVTVYRMKRQDSK